MRSWLLAVAVMFPAGALLLTAPLDAHAQAPKTKRVLRLIISASDPDFVSLDASLNELMSRIGGSVNASRADRIDTDDSQSIAVKTPDAFAVAWVDLKSGSRASVVVVDAKNGHIVARRSVPRGATGDIAVEEIAHIVQATVEDMADEEARVAASAPPPPPPPPSASVTTPPPLPVIAAQPPPAVSSAAPAPPVDADKGLEAGTRGYGVDVGAFLVGRAFGSDSNLVVGGGGGGALRLGRGKLRPTIGLSGAYFVPFDATGANIRVHATALTLRVSAGAQYRLSDRFFLEAAADGGSDVFFQTPQSDGVPQNRLDSSSTDASPMLGGFVGARFAITRGADLYAQVATDVDLAPHRYVVRDGPTNDAVWTPSRVRPAIVIGFTFSVAGDSYDPDATQTKSTVAVRR